MCIRDSVIHVVAERFMDLSAELPMLRDERLREGGDLFSTRFSGGPIAFPDDAALPLKSRDFH